MIQIRFVKGQKRTISELVDIDLLVARFSLLLLLRLRFLKRGPNVHGVA